MKRLLPYALVGLILAALTWTLVPAPTYTYVVRELSQTFSALQTFSAGLTVTGGTVTIPGVSADQKIVHICASGCEYTTLNAACAGETSTAAAPIMYYVHAGLYAAADTMCSGEDNVSFIGDGIGVTVLQGLDHGFGSGTGVDCTADPKNCKGALNLGNTTDYEVANMTLKGSRGIFAVTPSGVGGGNIWLHDLEFFTSTSNGDEDCFLLSEVQNNTVMHVVNTRCFTNSDGFTFGSTGGTGNEIYAIGNTCQRNSVSSTVRIGCWNLSSIPNLFEATGEDLSINSASAGDDMIGYWFVGTGPGASAGVANINGSNVTVTNTGGNGTNTAAYGIRIESTASELATLNLVGVKDHVAVSDATTGIAYAMYSNNTTTVVNVAGGFYQASGGLAGTTIDIVGGTGSHVSIHPGTQYVDKGGDAAMTTIPTANITVLSFGPNTATYTDAEPSIGLSLTNTDGSNNEGSPYLKLTSSAASPETVHFQVSNTGTLVLSNGSFTPFADFNSSILRTYSTQMSIGNGTTTDDDRNLYFDNITNDGFIKYHGTSAKNFEFNNAPFLSLPGITASPALATSGDFSIDTTANQWVYQSGSTVRVVDPVQLHCDTMRGLVGTDDNFIFFLTNQAVTVTGAGCKCAGTCGTIGTFTFEDNDANAMTLASSPLTCSATTTETAFTAITNDSASQLVAGNAVQFDVGTAPGTATDLYTICITYTVDRQ